MSEQPDQIARLLRNAGSRQQPGEFLVAAARKQAKEEWQLLIARKKRRRLQYFSLAASVVLGVVFWLSSGVTPEFDVELVQGNNVFVDDQALSERMLKLRPGTQMRAEAPVRIVALKNVDLRLAKNTQVEWLAADRLFVRSGSLYVDTHGEENFHVETHQASIRDIGTRYLVTVVGEKVQVAVREGKTEVSGGNRQVSLVGDGVQSQMVNLDQPAWKVVDEPASHSRWQWITQLSPDYENLIGQDLLMQLSRDAGKRLIFASPGVKAAVANLHRETGSFDGIRPELVLRAIVEGSDMELVETDSELIIGFADVGY